MEDVRNIDSKKIPLWRWRWYRYVANDLLLLIVDLRNEIAGKNGTIKEKNKTINDLQLRVKVAELETREVKKKIVSPVYPTACILTAHEHASKQRIRELESEVDKLKQTRFFDPYDMQS